MILKVVSAIVAQIVILGVYYYLDARSMLVQDFGQFIRSASSVWVAAWLWGSTIVLWWSYRVIYEATAKRFWFSTLIEGVLFQAVFIVASWIAVRKPPTATEWAGIAICAIGAIVSGWR